MFLALPNAGCLCGSGLDPALLDGEDAGDPGGCRTDADCVDDVDCTQDFCQDDETCTHVADGTTCEGDELCLATVGCVPRRPCEGPSDCEDGNPCSGEAQCVDHVCIPGTAVDCDDGVFCNGAETCDLLLGCVSTPPHCSDGVDCTVDECDLERDQCAHRADDEACSDGKYCSGGETCDLVLGCQPGAPPCQDEGCASVECVEADELCLRHADHSRCDPGRLCRDGGGGFSCEQVPCAGDSDCDDRDVCNGTERCALDGFCERREVSFCDDEVFCNGREYCDPLTGCHPQDAPGCIDGVGCTVDACDPVLDECVHLPSQAACDDGLVCDGAELCGPRGCEPGTPPSCDDDDTCTVDGCAEPSGCRATPRDQDRDGHGDAACGGTDCDDGDSFVFPGAEERCNDRDDDCDLEVDEDFSCRRDGVGTCTTNCGSTGLRTCTAACDWGPCAVGPEDCNGVDDDCDALIDEGCDCEANDPTTCLTACGSEGSRECRGGVWSPCTPPNEACNGRDDDCVDGIDNGFACTTGEVQACATKCGSTGSRVCSNACQWEPCVPAPEVCNGQDDDCAGGADNGFACAAGATRSCGTGCGTTGAETCTNGCAWSGACVPPIEICNGQDDDCDATCDEPAQCCAGSIESCTTPCGSAGSRICTGSCDWGDCTLPAEVCNGIDDDCDGTCDEPAQCCALVGAPCETSCFTTGTRPCTADCRWEGGCGAPLEVCNGADDDCDDQCDNGAGMVCCRGLTQTCRIQGDMQGTQVCGDTCAWGPCCGVSERCANNSDDDCDGLRNEAGCCNPPGEQETCNGRDDDCDGLCDEEFNCCLGTTVPCLTDCNTVGTRQCNDTCELEDCQEPPEDCNNGIDDDCDEGIDLQDDEC